MRQEPPEDYPSTLLRAGRGSHSQKHPKVGSFALLMMTFGHLWLWLRRKQTFLMSC